MTPSDWQRLLEWIIWPSIPLLYGLAVLWILTPVKEMNMQLSIHRVKCVTAKKERYYPILPGEGSQFWSRHITIETTDGQEFDIALFADQADRLNIEMSDVAALREDAYATANQ